MFDNIFDGNDSLDGHNFDQIQSFHEELEPILNQAMEKAAELGVPLIINACLSWEENPEIDGDHVKTAMLVNVAPRMENGTPWMPAMMAATAVLMSDPASMSVIKDMWSEIEERARDKGTKSHLDGDDGPPDWLTDLLR